MGRCTSGVQMTSEKIPGTKKPAITPALQFYFQFYYFMSEFTVISVLRFN